jgi:hypothetical protein
MIHSYINLILNTPDAVAGKGIVKLYSYRMGVLSADTSVLEEVYINLLEKNSKKVKSTLGEFANSMISYNLITLYRLMSNTLISDISRGFGNSSCLMGETLHAMYQFSRFHMINRGPRDQRKDGINGLVETCRYNAVTLYHTQGLSSVAEIISLLETIDKLIQKPLEDDEYARRNYLMNLVRVVFYIGCRYYQINILRFTDQNIKRPYTRNLGVNDFTLAAIPFDPTLIQSCTDEGSTMSQFGIEYVQSLHAVLSQLGGITCTVNFPAIKQSDEE